MSAINLNQENAGAIQKKIFKKVNVEKWEIDCIGEFLLKLYHAKEITEESSRRMLKQTIREKFGHFLKTHNCKNLKEKFERNNGTADIGSLLFRTKYLINTIRGSEYFHINISALLQYRNKKLEELDNAKRNGDYTDSNLSNNDIPVVETKSLVAGKESRSNANVSADPSLFAAFEVDANAEVHCLKYEGTKLESRYSDFQLSNLGCFICQKNFDSNEMFEEHVEEHGDESNFKYLSKMNKFSKPLVKISYQLCKDSHYIRFELETELSNVIIDKIIIIQSRSFYYVPKARVLYALPDNGKDTFFVDSHFFTIQIEQPIVLVFHSKQEESKRIIEQHHLIRIKEFPSGNLTTSPWRMPSVKTFVPKRIVLEHYPPNEICKVLESLNPSLKLSEIYKEFSDYVKNKSLSLLNFNKIIKILLQIEDMDIIRQYKSIVQRNAKIGGFDNEYLVNMTVPGGIHVEEVLAKFDEVLIVAENKQEASIPINFDNDEIMDFLLKNVQELLKKTYMNTIKIGTVVNISNMKVSFRCHQKISENEEYMIVFRPCRVPIRYQYVAVEKLSKMAISDKVRIFFPQLETPLILPLPDLKLQNVRINDNAEQLQAVRNIVQGPPVQAPYIIFGPPGTGKTTTIVEAILQLYICRPETKILVMAGSNSACDEITSRLCQTICIENSSRALTRIYSRSNESRVDNIDEDLLEASNMYSTHFLPDVDVIHEYRIVICTICMVGKLLTGRFGKTDQGRSLYTHIFIDEAAATTEAEALVGIVELVSNGSRLILSGDPKQLGPVLHSSLANELGFGVSLMERLMMRDCYRVYPETKDYNRSIQTRLCRNYRSHPEIVELYNHMYYNNELISLANVEAIALGRKWHRLPNPNFPVLFHCVNGNCRKGKNSLSYYNPQEVEVVMDYVKDFMFFGVNGEKIRESDIGIICPYKKQYQCIQEELNLRNWHKIETGSVEIFQGKEKSIIIASFVRSNSSTLGFLDNYRRLNVTISRAKSLLILVGNIRTLSINKDFRHIIELCRNHGNLINENEFEKSNYMNKISPQYTKENKGTNYNNRCNTKRENIANKSQPNKQNKSKLNTKKNEGSCKKHAQNGLQQKKNFNMYKNLVLTELVQEPESEIDKMFNELPQLPLNSVAKKEVKLTKVQNPVNTNKAKDNNVLEEEVKKLEDNIHKRMQKMRLNAPSAPIELTAGMSTETPLSATTATMKNSPKKTNKVKNKTTKTQTTVKTSPISSKATAGIAPEVLKITEINPMPPNTKEYNKISTVSMDFSPNSEKCTTIPKTLTEVNKITPNIRYTNDEIQCLRYTGQSRIDTETRNFNLQKFDDNKQNDTAKEQIAVNKSFGTNQEFGNRPSSSTSTPSNVLFLSPRQAVNYQHLSTPVRSLRFDDPNLKHPDKLKNKDKCEIC